MRKFMTKCLSCGHVTPEIELNCPECGSFYTLVVDDNEPENKSEGVITKIKNKFENIVFNDDTDKKE